LHGIGPRIPRRNPGETLHAAAAELAERKDAGSHSNRSAIREKDREAIQAAAQVLRGLLPVEEIFLFGSKSRGDDDAESDIDLLVLTARPLSHREHRAVCDALFPIEMAHDEVISALLVPAADWTAGPLSVLPIRAEVEEQGVPV
jgi:uncharacterized protein